MTPPLVRRVPGANLPPAADPRPSPAPPDDGWPGAIEPAGDLVVDRLITRLRGLEP